MKLEVRVKQLRAQLHLVFAGNEDAQLAENMERRHQGDEFRLLDEF